jgi:hypothetical protein
MQIYLDNWLCICFTYQQIFCLFQLSSMLQVGAARSEDDQFIFGGMNTRDAGGV